MSRERKLPLGRVARLARLAAAGARTGTGLLLSREKAVKFAEEAAEHLGTLRGLAAKVGQMASYVDGMVPEDVRPAFELGMARLRAAAPTSSSKEIRSVVEEELGAPVDVLFARWEDEPIASASIGQVHRAALHDGREVAVKVQHPGIQRAVESDLANASSVESLVRVLGAGKLGSKEALAEIRERFLEELDYVREAEQQRWFAAFHASDPKIVVPGVIDERSRRRVLTTELVGGRLLDDVGAEDESPRAASMRARSGGSSSAGISSAVASTPIRTPGTTSSKRTAASRSSTSVACSTSVRPTKLRRAPRTRPR